MGADIAELLARLSRYPAERYPAQHATAQFHLGAARLQEGGGDASLEALATAARIFADLGMQVEQAKAMMMQGAALRGLGRSREAGEAFTRAGDLFHGLDKPAEEAAALFNLGLVLAESEQATEAAKAFAAAQDLFLSAGQPAWSGAAARERGALLLNNGDPQAAATLLETALELLADADPAGAGAAANVLGLARLALEQPAAAVEAFRDALGWHPRSVRPSQHAMAKANLALAYEATGATAHARVTARHVLGVPDAPQPVQAVARGVLHRLGASSAADLFQVLDQEDPARRPAWVREELLLWTTVGGRDRTMEAARWVHEQVQRGPEGVEQAEILLGALLELPPPDYEAVITALVGAVHLADPAEAERFQSVTRSAMARYPLPQWQRMAGGFAAAAEREGADQTWT
jgi:tetratricopeptide (TPR) repeat protein